MKKIFFNRLFLTIVLFASLLLLSGIGSGVCDAQVKRVSILGGQVGGGYNFWTTAFAPYLTKEIPDVSFSAEGSSGSPENLRRIDKSEVELTLAFSSDIYQAVHGTHAFKGKPIDRFRALTFLFGSVAHLVTLKESSINKVEDIVDKRISMGGPGSGSALNHELYFTHLGLWGKFKPVFLAGMAASQAIKDRKIDAYCWAPGLGNASIIDTATTHDIRIIDMDTPAQKSGFYEKYPYFSSRKIPAGVYRGVPDVMTWQMSTIFLATPELPEDLVYRILKSIYSEKGVKHLKSAVGRPAQEMTPENAFLGITVPLHPGAAKFWKEMGKEIPARIAPK